VFQMLFSIPDEQCALLDLVRGRGSSRHLEGIKPYGSYSFRVVGVEPDPPLSRCIGSEHSGAEPRRELSKVPG
jgi:hypothetical protein